MYVCEMFKRCSEMIKKTPGITKPNAMCSDISELNFQKMKDMGFDKLIIKNLNVMTKPG